MWKCCKPEIRRARNGSSSPSDNGGQTEEPCHKRDLTNDVAFLQPPHLSLADHVHRLDALNRSRGRIEGAKSLTGSHPAFDRSVILVWIKESRDSGIKLEQATESITGAGSVANLKFGERETVRPRHQTTAVRPKSPAINAI